MSNLDIYCVTNKIIPSLEKTNYKIGWVEQVLHHPII